MAEKELLILDLWIIFDRKSNIWAVWHCPSCSTCRASMCNLRINSLCLPFFNSLLHHTKNRINVAKESRLRKLRKSAEETVRAAGSSGKESKLGGHQILIKPSFALILLPFFGDKISSQELAGDEYAKRLRQQFQKAGSSPCLTPVHLHTYPLRSPSLFI